MVGADRFCLVYVNTPIEVCERRDTKGMYAKAREGKLKGFTGVDDPYEAPVGPELVLTTTDSSPEENAQKVLQYLIERGFVLDGASASETRSGASEDAAPAAPAARSQPVVAAAARPD